MLGQLASWSSRGGWKENFFRLELDQPLSYMRKMYPTEWRNVMTRVFNDPERGPPFFPGFYSVQNVSTDYEMKVPPVYFYGNYRATMRAYSRVTRELVACERATLSVVPKSIRRRPHP
ncbi:hypothetical protein ONE63_007354 [Megalurothrips usitatus]|uniref:Uncharacterized protein n=1 Tax=Megalurothrips usitatus TaxID=439358 RepID=A0AAV7XSJ4_9NEOP|nr:hypothetical protein ONE63_007354 [Megalurothrips usitatus]